jgi:HD-GYP domain-containing protein (c-di-GMP phosphodiesterase class II)
LVLLLLPLLFSGCVRPAASASAAGGRADLARGSDFDRGDLVRLDGEWEFRPGALLTPEDFAAEERGEEPRQPAAFARVPGLWAADDGIGAPRSDPTGVGTLRLVLVLPPGDRDYGLRIPNANSAARVFVGGRLLAEIGAVGEAADRGYVPSNGVAVKEFRSSGGETEIVMQVANFSTPYIGTWDCPIIGGAEAIGAKRRGDLISAALVSGALLIMGLYHIGLFLLRKKDRTSLYFGIVCLLMTVRTLIMGERILLDFFPAGEAAWAWAFKLEHLSAHLTVPLFAVFFRELYPRYVRRVPVLVIVSVGAFWAFLIFAAPVMLYQRFLHWYELFLLVAGLYVLSSLIVAAVKREEGAAMVVLGLCFLLAAAANDVLLSIGVIANTVYLASYGVFLYIFTQSFHLSMIFSKAFRDIEDLSEGLREKNRELESLHTIDLAIASSMELGMILTVILEQAKEHLGADAADILLLDQDVETLSLGARLGFRTDALLHTRLKSGQGFAGRALLSDEAIFASRLDLDAAGFSRSPAFAEESFVFYAGRRLTVKDKTVGVIELYRRLPFAPSPSWELFFRTLAGQAAIALDNSALLLGLRRANAELEEANEGTIESWAEALELRDQETEGHSRRVTEATVSLAREFGLSGPELDRVRKGALLHDIGKMGIPDSILLKPGPLDQDEFAVMKRHPVIARDLLSRLRFLHDSLDIPYCHHEKWDGSGYPQGLAGEAIPLPARLFAVVDVWDALRSNRPYRQSWTEDRVLDHIAALSGSHFDSRAVEAFIELRRKASG